MFRVFIVKKLSKKTVNMFEGMEITGTIYEVLIEPSYKKTTREYSNYSGHSRKMRRGAAPLYYCQYFHD